MRRQAVSADTNIRIAGIVYVYIDVGTVTGIPACVAAQNIGIPTTTYLIRRLQAVRGCWRDSSRRMLWERVSGPRAPESERGSALGHFAAYERILSAIRRAPCSLMHISWLTADSSAEASARANISRS